MQARKPQEMLADFFRMFVDDESIVPRPHLWLGDRAGGSYTAWC